MCLPRLHATVADTDVRQKVVRHNSTTHRKVGHMVSMIRQLTLLLIAGVALAQTATSRITGTVSDASGALVPGAMVTAKNEATGVTYTQTTTEAGLYGFPSVPVGIYAITSTLPGFKTANRTGN